MNLKLNLNKIAIISGCVLAFGILNGFVLFPGLLKFMLKRVSSIKFD